MTDSQINAAIAAHLGITRGIPDFTGDLNEMHEAEKLIYNQNNMWTAYYYAIGAGPFSLHATARKKAEAFLKAVGKWSATTEESSAVQSTSSGGSGGASTYGGKGLGIAGAAWPPETRISRMNADGKWEEM